MEKPINDILKEIEEKIKQVDELRSSLDTKKIMEEEIFRLMHLNIYKGGTLND